MEIIRWNLAEPKSLCFSLLNGSNFSISLWDFYKLNIYNYFYYYTTQTWTCSLWLSPSGASPAGPLCCADSSLRLRLRSSFFCIIILKNGKYDYFSAHIYGRQLKSESKGQMVCMAYVPWAIKCCSYFLTRTCRF